MSDLEGIGKKSGPDGWKRLSLELESIMSIGEPIVTSLANAAALLYHSLDRINWAGFYLVRGNELLLGPFAGQPACTVIPIGKGVCGAAASERKTIVVRDVDQFPGHIACDAASRSEIVVPLILPSGELIGVLDLDSPEVGRFGDPEQLGLEGLREVLIDKLKYMIVAGEPFFF